MPERTSIAGLPPGPRLPLGVQTAWWGTDPIGLFDRSAERFGDVFTLKLGYRGKTVCVASPEAVKALFLGDPGVFHAGDAYEILGPVAGDQSLLLLDEEEHLRMRRLLLPPLHGKALEAWSSVIAGITEEVVAEWPWNRPFPVRPSMERITLDVIMRIVFGIRDRQRAEELRGLLPHMFDIGPVLGSAFLFPTLRRDLGAWSVWGRFLRRRDRVDRLLYAEIAERRAELAARGPNDPQPTHQDVLTLLLETHDETGRGLSDRELRDGLITMLLAGQETTATALSWAFERLVRHPRELSILEAELGESGNEYLDAVIKETLRARPVVAQVGRVLTEETEVQGWTVPAGRMVMGLISRVHGSPQLYAEPWRFRPERFLEGEGDGYAWIPFGGGVRRCIGAGLALLEMRTVLTTVLQSVRLTAPRAAPERAKVRGITLVPARGGEVIFDSAT